MLRSRMKVGGIGFAILLVMTLAAPTQAQVIQQQVGGVLIDADGMLRQITDQQRTQQIEDLRKNLAAVPGDLAEASEVRKISLRKLNDALAKSVAERKPVSDELRYLGGLQRVEYVVVLPEEKDILLVGPGGAWQANDTGDVVGTNTGLPVILLDDLIVAMRSANGARTETISCSIDPTAEGRVAFKKYVSKQKRFHNGIMETVKKLMGPQKISLTGVSKESHFAQVLAAADYRMKRIAMHLEESPVDDIPSFLELAKKRRGAVSDLMPRWWLACDYEPLGRSEDGMTWELRGNSVKAMTEDQVIHRDGSVEQTGKTNHVAAEWATAMTENYDQLCTVEPVFGQLRNVMDLSVIAALIQHQDMLNQSGCGELEMLTSPKGDTLLGRWSVPEWVATESSIMKKGRSFILTASGGVELDPWYYASRSEVSESAEQLRKSVKVAEGWRWN